VQFGEPHHVEPEALAGVDLFHGLVEGLALAPPWQRRKLVEHAEFHDLTLPGAPKRRRSPAKRAGAGQV
jgi:hypothetical protein